MAIDYEVEYNNRARVPEHRGNLRALGSATARPIATRPARKAAPSSG